MSYAHVQYTESPEERKARVVAAIQALKASHEQALSPHLTELYGVFLDWQRTDPRKATTRQGLAFDGYLSAFAAYTGLRASSLYEWLDAGQAGYTAPTLGAYPLTQASATATATGERALIGHALRENWTPDRIESVLYAGGLSALREALSPSESGNREQIDAARERAATLNPDLPKQKKVQDELNAGLVNVLPEPILRAAYAAARGEQAGVDVLAAVQEESRPFSEPYFTAHHYPCAHCGLLPGEGERLDLHHVGYDWENPKRRSEENEDEELLLGVHRECHVPQPGVSDTAHIKQHVWIEEKFGGLTGLMAYRERRSRAYQRWIGVRK